MLSLPLHMTEIFVQFNPNFDEGVLCMQFCPIGW